MRKFFGMLTNFLRSHFLRKCRGDVLQQNWGVIPERGRCRVQETRPHPGDEQYLSGPDQDDPVTDARTWRAEAILRPDWTLEWNPILKKKKSTRMCFCPTGGQRHEGGRRSISLNLPLYPELTIQYEFCSVFKSYFYDWRCGLFVLCASE